MHTTYRATALLFAVGLGACGGTPDKAPPAAGDSTEASAPPAASTPAAQPDSGGMQGMSGMQGMQGMQMNGGGMAEQMRAHLKMMEGMGADSMMAALPAHRQMTANMLAQMNTQMRQMNMPANPGWTATMDSIRQDLKTLPSLSAAELPSAMSAHRARIERLMTMHQGMMASMKM